VNPEEDRVARLDWNRAATDVDEGGSALLPKLLSRRRNAGPLPSFIRMMHGSAAGSS
jgi:hypothetical protein